MTGSTIVFMFVPVFLFALVGSNILLRKRLRRLANSIDALCKQCGTEDPLLPLTPDPGLLPMHIILDRLYRKIDRLLSQSQDHPQPRAN